MGERSIDWLPPLDAQMGTESAAWTCSPIRDRTGNLSVISRHSNQLSHTGQGNMINYNKNIRVPLKLITPKYGYYSLYEKMLHFLTFEN